MRIGRILAVAGVSLATLVAGVTVASAQAAPVAAAPPGIDDFRGIIKLDNCSASLVKFRDASADNAALMLTNGHCFEGGMPKAGQVFVNKASTRSGTLLKADGSSAGTVKADKALYVTMTDTDVSLYRLTTTYKAIQDKYGIAPIVLAEQGPKTGDKITVNSGYWTQRWHCSMDGQVYRLKEDQWTWKDSIRYSENCDTPHGSSGSPLLSDVTGEVVGINNTGNDDGAKCTMNNPCEVDQAGKITVLKKRSYAEQTWWFTGCKNAKAELDLTVAGCQLPKPTRTGYPHRPHH